MIFGRLLADNDLLNFVTDFNLVDHIQSFCDFSEASVLAVQVSRIGAAVADEELRTARIKTRMSHRKYAPIVVLISAAGFAIDIVSGTTSTVAFGASALDDEVVQHAVKGQAVVEAFFRQISKILDGIGSVGVVKIDVHHTFCGVQFSFHDRFVFD